MKVSEMINMITNCNNAAVIDRNTNKVVYVEERDGGEESHAFIQCKDLEVVAISAGKTLSNEVDMYVDATKTYETYLDVVYSTKVTLTVPINADLHDAFQVRGLELVKMFPREMKFGDITFRQDDDNMISGSYYDMIEESAPNAFI